MRYEYRCTACGRLMWFTETDEQTHACTTCNGVTKRTGRPMYLNLLPDPSDYNDNKRIHQANELYPVHLDTFTKNTIQADGTILDDNFYKHDKSA